MLSYICSKCGHENAPTNKINDFKLIKCPSCGNKNNVEIFPAILREIAKGEKPEIALSEEATCFNHPQHIAVSSCDHCGVYMCKLCDIEIEGKHVCSNCLEKPAGKLKTTKAKTFLADELALHLVTVPIIFVYAFFITSPAAVCMSIYYWNKVKTPYPRSKWRFVAAITLGLLETLGIIALIISIITGNFNA